MRTSFWFENPTDPISFLSRRKNFVFTQLCMVSGLKRAGRDTGYSPFSAETKAESIRKPNFPYAFIEES